MYTGYSSTPAEPQSGALSVPTGSKRTPDYRLPPSRLSSEATPRLTMLGRWCAAALLAAGASSAAAARQLFEKLQAFDRGADGFVGMAAAMVYLQRVGVWGTEAAYSAARWPETFPAVRAVRGQLSGISVSHRQSISCGAFVWARRALSGSKRRFPARADL